MDEPLNILFVEDARDDMELTLLKFEEKGIHVNAERVESAADLKRSLVNHHFHLVICDHRLPGFSGAEALEIITNSDEFLPVIIVSGTIGEEAAVQMLKKGASDYLMKNNLAKLVTATEKAIQEKKLAKKNFIAEQKLKESEERFRGIVENSNAGYFYFNHEGLLKKANNAFLFLHKYNHLSEVLNKHYSDFFKSVDDNNVEEYFEQVFKGFAYGSMDIKRMCKDGSVGFQTTSMSPRKKQGVIVGVEGFVIDITDKKFYEQEIITKQREKEAILNNISEFVVYFDKDLNMVWTNREIMATNGEINNFRCHKLFYNSDKRCDKCPVQKALETKSIQEKEVEVEDNVFYLIRAYPIIDAHGEVSNVIEVGWDLTERKQAEKDLKLAKEKAEESDRLKTAFLSNMSHEIRTPMNAIIGFSQLLLKPNIDEKEREVYVDYVKNNGESLIKIIDDIIDISKIQSNQITLFERPFNLKKLIHELLAYHNKVLENADNKKVDLVFEWDKSMDESKELIGDEVRLRQVLNNLITNATKYTSKGHIKIGIKNHNNFIHFKVADTGSGIPKLQLPIIFDRFVQYSPDFESRNFGTGLGLAISKELVELMGGTIGVESEEGKGAVFNFTIPYKPNVTVVNDKWKDKNIQFNWKDKTILIVDDEESNFVLTRRLLKDTGAGFEWAKDGQEAIDRVNDNDYQLIVMDIKMPNVDGIEATKRIKQNKPYIPIIIQSAYSMSVEREKALKAGCDDYFTKPIKVSDFLKKLNTFLQIKDK